MPKAPSRLYEQGSFVIDLSRLVLIKSVFAGDNGKSKWGWIIDTGSANNSDWTTTEESFEMAVDHRRSMLSAWQAYCDYVDGIKAQTAQPKEEKTVDNVKEHDRIDAIESLEVK